MTIKLSSKGGGGLPKLAPNLTFPSSLSGTSGHSVITGINAVGSLTTALSLTGKFMIDLLRFDGLLAESMIFKLTVDGVVIWNDTFTPASNLLLIGNDNTAGIASAGMSPIQCDSSLLLEVQTTTDTSINLYYLARPIL